MKIGSLIGIALLGCALTVLFSSAMGATGGPESREGSTITVSTRSSAKDDFTHTVLMEDGSATW